MKQALLAFAIVAIAPSLVIAQNTQTPDEPVVHFPSPTPRLSQLAMEVLSTEAYLMAIDPELQLAIFDDSKPGTSESSLANSAKGYLITKHRVDTSRVFINYEDALKRDRFDIIRFNAVSNSTAPALQSQASIELSDKYLAKLYKTLEASVNGELICETLEPVAALKYGKSTRHQVKMIHTGTTNSLEFDIEHSIRESEADSEIGFIRSFVEVQVVSKKAIRVPLIQRSSDKETLELNLATIDLEMRSIRGKFTRENLEKAQAPVLCRF